MILSVLMVILGLILLIWSADQFVEGAAAVAKNLGMSTLLIGMIVVGFGTSAPELAVSALSAVQGNPGLALGNAYGSNITNIGLILGVTALFSPLLIHKSLITKELAILIFVTLLSFVQLIDGTFTRLEGLIDLAVLISAFSWLALTSKAPLIDEHDIVTMKTSQAWFWLGLGLILLVVSSRMLVWGAVNIAQHFGVSDLIIGLTVVAIGTSLPELAASIVAARKGEHDLVLGNVIGSNLFNTLGVIGLAGVIHPMQVPTDMMQRDWPVMMLLTLSVLMIGFHQKKNVDGFIKQQHGGMLLFCYVAYTVYLISTGFL